MAEEFDKFSRLQVQTYALQVLLSNLLVRWLEATDRADDAAEDLLSSTLQSIGKYHLRGDHDEETLNTARATMEAFATETVLSAVQSARARRLGPS